jgi:hypothetical protein
MHTVESTPETVRSGFLDPTAPPAATIASGDVVSYPNTWTHWGNEAVYGMTFAEREPLRHRYPNGPYSMLGPVVVTDAQVGDVIECKLELCGPATGDGTLFRSGSAHSPLISKSPTCTTSVLTTPAVPLNTCRGSSSSWRRFLA